MGCSWLVISNAEKDLANSIVKNFFGECNRMDECLSVFTKEYRRIIEQLPNPYLCFATDETSVSNNVITQVAYSLSERLGFNGANGVVLTSHILAIEMVKISLIEWFKINSKYDEKDLFNLFYHNEKKLLQEEPFVNSLACLRWYDPCVGGGVYPLAIISVLRSIGYDGDICIYGKDMNPLYVESTKIRIALSYGDGFDTVFHSLDDYFEVGDALDSYLDQPSLLDSNEMQTFDIVIGNPPYLSAGKINPVAKNKYSANYPRINSKMTDLYTYFIAHGLNALNHKGVLTYVTPAQFQMSNYGRSIRKDIDDRAGLLTIADFDELPVFKKIGAHICVFSLSKGVKANTFLRREYDYLPERDALGELYTCGHKLSQKNIGVDGWNFSSDEVYEILSLLSSRGEKLKDYSPGVYSGIKSSCKKAFWLKINQLDGFSEYDMNFVKKLIIPKCIRRWHTEWNNDFLAVIKKDDILDEGSRIYNHMLAYKEELSKRSDIHNHPTWYGLRECNYYDKMGNPKIMYPDISTSCRFVMDTEGFFIPDGAFFIPSEDYYLLGVLNSCIGRYYFKEKCARIGNPQKGGRIRFKKVYVEDFPVVPKLSNPQIAMQIEKIAIEATIKGTLPSSLEEELDTLVMNMYQIPNKLKKILLEAKI